MSWRSYSLAFRGGFRSENVLVGHSSSGETWATLQTPSGLPGSGCSLHPSAGCPVFCGCLRHPCQLLHRILCHRQLGPLVRACLPCQSGSLDILSQYVMWSLAQWWQGAQMWCIQRDIIGAIISPCLMTMTGVGHFHMPLWAGLVWIMLCDTIKFTYPLSSLWICVQTALGGGMKSP